MTDHLPSPDQTNSEISQRLSVLEATVCDILARNARVENDKAWETSWFRLVFVATITYCVTAVVFAVIAVPRAPLNAIIPTAGYVLSTLGLPWLKRWWLMHRG